MAQMFELKPKTWMILINDWGIKYCILSIGEPNREYKYNLMHQKPTGLKNGEVKVTFGSILSMVQWFNTEYQKHQLEITMNYTSGGCNVIVPDGWTVEIEEDDIPILT